MVVLYVLYVSRKDIARENEFKYSGFMISGGKTHPNLLFCYLVATVKIFNYYVSVRC